MCICGCRWTPGAVPLCWEKKEGIRDSWQWGISCVHIHQACWRLEDRAEMRLEAYSMCSHCICTHTGAHMPLTHTHAPHLQAQTLSKAPDPALELCLPHCQIALCHTQWRTEEEQSEKNKKKTLIFPPLCSHVFFECHNYTTQGSKQEVKNEFNLQSVWCRWHSLCLYSEVWEEEVCGGSSTGCFMLYNRCLRSGGWDDHFT